jgi:hypothetical protein
VAYRRPGCRASSEADAACHTAGEIDGCAVLLQRTGKSVSPAQTTIVHLSGGLSPGGAHILDEVLAEPIAKNKYRVLRSPALTLGIAAGDTIELTDRTTGRFVVIERGGNVAVQLHMPANLTRVVDDEFVPAVEKLGGTVDTRVDYRMVVSTLPGIVGFDAIESLFGGFVERHPSIQWYYGNVYDPEDGVTPLNWW